ncbi:MAG: hypothetical protein WC878_01645 [Candidatus Paceibacterota bacterium]
MTKKIILALVAASVFLSGAQSVLAQESQSTLYVPLIGITSVPDPLALPKGAGDVTYHYAVKNFLEGLSLSNVSVVDDMCRPVKFMEGDDNGNSELDYDETWRYSCTTKISKTTESTATVTGVSHGITAMHKSYATVVVGSDNLPPLVSIINITKVAYPLSLPIEGGDITFTYKVNNPGIVPLSKVTVIDDKCNAMSGKLGDTNGNNLLDANEVWIYTCTTNLKQTTTNTVRVTAFANGLKAVGSAALLSMFIILLRGMPRSFRRLAQIPARKQIPVKLSYGKSCLLSWYCWFSFSFLRGRKFKTRRGDSLEPLVKN